jgi:hypothetical protein
VKGAAVIEKPFDSDELLKLIEEKLAGRSVGETGRHAAEDGRGHWQLGGLSSGNWREGLEPPRTGGGDEDIDAIDDDEDLPELK